MKEQIFGNRLYNNLVEENSAHDDLVEENAGIVIDTNITECYDDNSEPDGYIHVEEMQI